MPKDYAQRLIPSKKAPWLSLLLAAFLISMSIYAAYRYAIIHIHWPSQKTLAKPKTAKKTEVILLPTTLWQATIHGGYFFIGGKTNINDQAVAKTDQHTFYGPYLTLNQAIKSYNTIIKLSTEPLILQFIPAQFPNQHYDPQ